MGPVSGSRLRFLSLITICLAVLCGFALRIRGITTEFWLDEIWSLRMAQEARSVLDIFTSLHHDNNHPLNTVYLYLVGTHPNWMVYRVLSFVCGLATIALLLRAARNRTERVFVAIFGSLSLPMVVYSTEARGYAPAAAFAVAAYLAARERRGAALALMAILSFVAHLTGLFIYAGLLAAAIVRWARRERPAHDLAPHVIASGAAILLYLTFVRPMIVGGGPPRSRISAAIAAASRIGGWGEAGVSSLIVAAVVVAILLFEIVRRRSDPAEIAFFSVALFAAPAMALTFQHGTTFYERYFFVCVPFAFLLLASFCEWLWRSRPAVAIALVVLWTAATFVQLTPFLRFGRGHYIEALRYMAQQSGGTAEVSGANGFRTSTMIGFADSYIGPGLRIQYHPMQDRSYARTEWFLVESFNTTTTWIPPLIDLPGGIYERAKTFPYGGISGWTWIVYRRAGHRP